MLRHPCILGGLQRQARGARSKVVPNKGKQNDKWPSRGPKRGRKCYVTPAFSGVPNAKRGEQDRKWSPTKGNKMINGLLEGPKEGGNATSPLHSRRSPTPSAGTKIGSGPQQRKTKLEMAASPLPSQGPKRGRKCYVTPAFPGIPNAKRGEGNQKRSPTKGNKIRSGYLTPACL